MSKIAMVKLVRSVQRIGPITRTDEIMINGVPVTLFAHKEWNGIWDYRVVIGQTTSYMPRRVDQESTADDIAAWICEKYHQHIRLLRQAATGGPYYKTIAQQLLDPGVRERLRREQGINLTADGKYWP